MKTTIDCTTEEIQTMLSYISYLESHLKSIDCSGDFAPDEETSVNAYELLTDCAAYEALVAATK